MTQKGKSKFRTRWQLRTADALLHYTRMSVENIARRSGMGTRNNMYFIYEHEFNLSPTERRRQLREKGDVGRFAIKRNPAGSISVGLRKFRLGYILTNSIVST